MSARFDWRTREGRRLIQCRESFIKNLRSEWRHGERFAAIWLRTLGGLGSPW